MPASRFRFHPAAEIDLNEAADWYEARRAGLGLELSQEVRKKIATLLRNPNDGVS